MDCVVSWCHLSWTCVRCLALKKCLDREMEARTMWFYVTIGSFFPMGTKLASQLGRALMGYCVCIICVQITYFVYYESGCADGWIDTRMQDTRMMSGIMGTGRVYSSNFDYAYYEYLWMHVTSLCSFAITVVKTSWELYRGIASKACLQCSKRE